MVWDHLPKPQSEIAAGVGFYPRSIMKALVTGGTGLVGGNLIRELVARGWDVRALVRKSSNTIAFDDQKRVERTPGDLSDPKSLAIAMKGCEIVFHCAAMVAMWAPNFEAMRRINVDGTRNVLDAAIAAGARLVVHCSTVDAIGFNTPDGWGTIDKPSHEGISGPNTWARIPYMTTKHMAQELALRYHREKKMDVIVVNPTFMLGPYDVKPSSGQMIIEVARGIAKAYPAGGNNFIHVGDVVKAMANAVQKGRPGELYILGNENLFYKEILAKIAGVIGVKPPWFALPKFLSLAIGAAASAGGILFGWAGFNPETINYRVAQMAFVQHFFDSTKARNELELQQKPIEIAIEDGYRWFIDHGYL
jgi:dihydroflavonol-4-reductase